MNNRYFVDERVGCIAVRDRFKTDPAYQGLHYDTDGVVEYCHGTLDNNRWNLSHDITKIYQNRCDDLNLLHYYSEYSPCGAD